MYCFGALHILTELTLPKVCEVDTIIILIYRQWNWETGDETCSRLSAWNEQESTNWKRKRRESQMEGVTGTKSCRTVGYWRRQACFSSVTGTSAGKAISTLRPHFHSLVTSRNIYWAAWWLSILYLSLTPPLPFSSVMTFSWLVKEAILINISFYYKSKYRVWWWLYSSIHLF